MPCQASLLQGSVTDRLPLSRPASIGAGHCCQSLCRPFTDGLLHWGIEGLQLHECTCFTRVRHLHADTPDRHCSACGGGQQMEGWKTEHASAGWWAAVQAGIMLIAQ